MMYIRIASARISLFCVLECTLWNMLSSNVRKDHSRRIRSRWTLYSRQIQLTEINFLEGRDFLLCWKSKRKKKRKEGDILFPCYPRVARSLKSARLYTRRICRLWKCFSPAPTTIFPTISRRTSSIMCLLLDVYPSLLTDYLWSTFFTQLSVEMLVLSLERYWTSRLDGSHQDLLYLTLLAATMKTMYDSSESRSSTDVVAVSRAGFWIVVARWRPKDTRSRTDNGTGREKRLILYLSDLHLCAARKAQPYRSSLSSRSKEQFFSKIRIYR